jgi:hypothetical protein
VEVARERVDERCALRRDGTVWMSFAHMSEYSFAFATDTHARTDGRTGNHVQRLEGRFLQKLEELEHNNAQELVCAQRTRLERLQT